MRQGGTQQIHVFGFRGETTVGATFPNFAWKYFMAPIEVDDDFLKYDPGSPGAVERGCTCPQAENNFGRGRSKTASSNQALQPIRIVQSTALKHLWESKSTNS